MAMRASQISPIDTAFLVPGSTHRELRQEEYNRIYNVFSEIRNSVCILLTSPG